MMTDWPNKDPSENFLVEFDFSKSTTSITSATVTVTLLSGTDASPASILVGQPSFFEALVRQRLNAGVPGCRYSFKCVASNGTDTFVLETTMAVGYGDTGLLAVTDFTTFDEVRAALGVSDEEVSDITLGLPMYGNHLSMELDELSDTVGTSVTSAFKTVINLAPAARSDAQRKVYASTRLFATYAVARHLGTSLAMVGPKSISDGKAVLTRFSDSPYKSTLVKIESQYERAKASLTSAVAALASQSTSTPEIAYFGVASPSFDPVIGS